MSGVSGGQLIVPFMLVESIGQCTLGLHPFTSWVLGQSLSRSPPILVEFTPVWGEKSQCLTHSRSSISLGYINET